MSLLTSIYLAFFSGWPGASGRGGGGEAGAKLALEGFRTFNTGGPSADQFARSTPTE